ncbi:MAG: hypothetical protein AAGU32_19075 [Bacillota bacterium]
MLRKQWGLRRNLRRRPFRLFNGGGADRQKKKGFMGFDGTHEAGGNKPKGAQVLITCSHYTTETGHSSSTVALKPKENK